MFNRQYRSISLSQFVGDEQGIAKMLPGLQATGIAIRTWSQDYTIYENITIIYLLDTEYLRIL